VRRVAFISTTSARNLGGSELLWSRSALALLERGVKVAANLRYSQTLHPDIAHLVGAGCQLGMRRRRGMVDRLVQRAFPGRFSRVDAEVGRFKWLDRLEPHLVVLSEGAPFSLTDWMLACQQKGIPYAIVVHGASGHLWPNGDVERHARAYAAALAAGFVSGATRRLVERQLGCSLPNATVVFNPFNVRFDACPRWPDEREGFILACVGRLDPATKGQDLLLEVLSQAKWRSRPISANIFGEGPGRAALERLRLYLQLGSVEFRGHAEDIEAIWATHHGLVLPSRAEGLPIALVEAMLCQRIGIVTDIGGSAEMLDDGVEGFVAAAPSVSLVDEALERAWESRADWRSMGLAAGRRIRREVPENPIARFADWVLGLLERGADAAQEPT
jgi:glycosyltransferase involved in cell wall biosynthesis